MSSETASWAQKRRSANTDFDCPSDTRKVEHLLAAFEEAQKPATYLALDISKASLDQNVGYLIDRHCSSTSKVRCAGIWGTFENGREWISEQLQGPRLFLSLGSVLCNDEFQPAVQHLKEWKDVMRPGDLLLVGMDGHTAEADKDKIEDAYHSQPELARKFFLTGFEHANKLLGADLFQPQDWEFSCRLEHGDLATRHRVFFEPNKDVTCGELDISIKAGEKYEWFDSHKYGENNVRLMCTKAGLSVVQVLKLPESEFRESSSSHFVTPTLHFPFPSNCAE